MSPIMNEAMPREDFERMERGEKIQRPKVIPRPEPEFPKVDNLIKFDDIPPLDFIKIISASMRRIQNVEKVNFIGYDVVLLMKGKRSPGRPAKDEEGLEPSPVILKGWMVEGDYEKLRRQR